MSIDQVRNYVLEKYPTRFNKSEYVVDGKKKIRYNKYYEPKITESDAAWFITGKKDESPLILSKDIVNG